MSADTYIYAYFSAYVILVPGGHAQCANVTDSFEVVQYKTIYADRAFAHSVLYHFLVLCTLDINHVLLILRRVYFIIV